MMIMRKIQNRIEKKEHGFIVNVMANKDYYRFCQLSFLYSYSKLAMTGKKDTLSQDMLEICGGGKA